MWVVSKENNMKGKKEYNKSHKDQDGIKILELTMIVVCVMEAHMKSTWAIIKSDKRLYMLYQQSNATNNDLQN